MPGAGPGGSNVDDAGHTVPVTPPRQYILEDSPRASGERRSGEFAEDDTPKRQRVDDAKRQRVNQMKMDYEKRNWPTKSTSQLMATQLT